MKKRIFSLLLAALMLFGMTACTAKQEVEEQPQEVPSTSTTTPAEPEVKVEETEPAKEEITLHYYLNNGAGETPDTPLVEEKLNQILDTIPGHEYISIDLHQLNDAESEFTLAQAAGNPIDMVTTYGLSFASRVADGDFLQLDDLLAQFPGVTSDVPEFLIDYGKLNGEQYYVPSYQKLANLFYAGVPAEYFQMYVDYTGNTEEQVTAILEGNDFVAKLDFLEDLCLAVREGTGVATKWIDVSTINGWQLLMGNLEYIGTNYGPINIMEGEAPSYWYLTEEYKMVEERKAKWYQEGLLHPDYLTIEHTNFNGDKILNEESYVNMWGINTCSTDYMEEYIWTAVPTVAFCTSDHCYIPSQYAAGGNAIYVDTQYPEECMMIIELLMTEEYPEFYNTMVYGVEGIHWEWADKANNKIQTIQSGETAAYAARAWAIGNTFNKWLSPTENESYYTYIDEQVHNGADTVSSPVMGITWDLSSVQDKIDQCAAILQEYIGNIAVSDDWEASYDEFMNKLELAGAQDILTEVTAQYEAFVG